MSNYCKRTLDMINKIAWWIPIKKYRCKYRNKTSYLGNLINGYYNNRYKKFHLSSLDNLMDDSYFNNQSEYTINNTWYQHGLTIKNYAGFDDNFKMPATIEHGLILNHYITQYEVDNNIPLVLTYANHRIADYKRVCDKDVIAIGPYIHYAEPLLTEKEIIKEKKRLGKTLLIMPSHSSVSAIVVGRGDNSFFDKIKEISKNYDTIKVCLHWYDVENHLYNDYIKFGYEIVTAGYESNHLFMSRLKTIIMLSDMIICEGVGTHVGYAIYLKVPLLTIKPNLIKKRFAAHNNTNKNEYYEVKGSHGSEIIDEIQKAFSEYSYSISDKQYQIINKYWGLDSIKTKNEMRDIILKYDEQYSKVENKWREKYPWE